LAHYAYSRTKEIGKDFPDYWLVIYTLPDHKVYDWSSQDYKKRYHAYEIMSQNPHDFYKRGFKDPAYLARLEAPDRRPNIAEYPGISEFTENENWNSRRIFLINLTIDGLELDFPERFNRRFDFK